MFFILKIALIIVLALLIIFAISRARKIAKEKPFSYRTVSILGLIIFLASAMVVNIIRVLTYIRYGQVEVYGGYTFFTDLINVFVNISYFAFPLALIFSLFLIISNAILLKKEGKSLTNILGLLLGIVLITLPLLISNIYTMLESVIDVHSYAGYHITTGIETFIAITLVYLECMYVATIIVAIKVTRYQPTLDKDYLIILGCYVRNDGLPGRTLQRRVDAAYDFAKKQIKETGKAPTIIASGGQGSDEVISEAESMKRYLRNQKKYKGKIILEDKSTTTRENFVFSKKIVQPRSKVAFATTDFHVFRSGVIASKAGINNVVGIAARSPWYYYNNALIREFVANMNSNRRLHILILLFLYTLSITYLLFSYIYDLM